MRRLWIIAWCAAICLAPLAAHGQSLDGGAALDRHPVAVVDRPLTLPGGILEIWAPLGISLSNGAGGKPTFFNPSFSYGVSDVFTIGLRHLLGMCLSGSEGNCPKFYNDVSLDALYALIRTPRAEVAGGAALSLAPITDPTAVTAEVRLPIKVRAASAFALVLSPALNFGLNERDVGPSARKRYGVTFNAGTYDLITPAETAPNREVLRIPLTVQLQLRPELALLAGASVDGAFDPPVGSFGDVYRVPVMAGLVFVPGRFIDLGAALTFPDLLGKDGTADDRFLSAFVALRM
jgi:hypothetical protein